MSEEKWVIQKWRTGDRFEGLTIPEALSMLFSLAEEEGYGLGVDYPKQGETFLYKGRWQTADFDYASVQHLILTPPAPEPEPNEWEAWCNEAPISGDFDNVHLHNLAIVDWLKRMPRQHQSERRES